MVSGSASARPGRQDVGFKRICRGLACYRRPRRIVVLSRFPPSLATSCSMSAVWDGAGRYGREASLERITAATTAGSDERHVPDPSGPAQPGSAAEGHRRAIGVALPERHGIGAHSMSVALTASIECATSGTTSGWACRRWRSGLTPTGPRGRLHDLGPDHPRGPRVREPARAGRALRRASRVVLPDRRPRRQRGPPPSTRSTRGRTRALICWSGPVSDVALAL